MFPLTSVMSAESLCRQMVSPKHTQVFTCERSRDEAAAQSSPKINSVLALVEGEPQDPYKTRSGSFGAGPRTTVGLVWSLRFGNHLWNLERASTSSLDRI